MKIIEIIGIIAGLLQIGCKIPQVIKIIQIRDSKAISSLMYILLLIAVILWLIYGIVQKDIPVFLTACCNFILISFILILKIIYK